MACFPAKPEKILNLDKPPIWNLFLCDLNIADLYSVVFEKVLSSFNPGCIWWGVVDECNMFGANCCGCPRCRRPIVEK